ncbi:MAG: TrkA family potassium uptake protein [Chitinophagaceae bacterium]|nr:TrkA family potassium uptake protein [Anaerolineae bacterium]
MPYSQLVLPRGRRRISRLARGIRAILRDTSALFKEFRQPLLMLLIALFMGGYLYRELMFVAQVSPVPPYVDMPYVMLALMLLQAPLSLPDKPYLIAFWYVMPVLGVYIIGRGAADFVRLFFNRNDRRDAWEEAVASTYRNHIIVLGAGHVGLRVTRTLVQMGFDVVVIDQSVDDEKKAQLGGLNVPTIPGDGRQITTLEKAGLRDAQCLVVCTSNELVNLETVMRARDMNPDIRIVARSWDTQFANQLKRFMGVNAVLSASELAAPVFAGMAVGIEITQTLVINGEEFSMIRLTVEPQSFLDGENIHHLQAKNLMDIVLHGRNDAINVHPEGETIVQAGDTLVIFARHDKIIDIVGRNRQRGR